MSSVEHEEEFAVVVNGEQQYSVWPAHREVPDGWEREGTVGPKDTCLAHISRVWTDMRPLSLRHAMDGQPPKNM
ncbi:MbtH family NRPS accessory protein [Streptomyces sp. NPDC020996]|uniref:MbtH family protein n=1 Tax=unclassified Streptomyces TaxID=2593676 RepID=UPI0033FB855F